MELHPALIFLGGLVVIIVGAELVLRGATRVASLAGIPPIIIGLTVVSVGTSLPELAVGITATLDGAGPMAVGNIAGTNLVNILFILGLSAAIRPIHIQLPTIRFDVPMMIAASMLLLIMAWDGLLDRTDGAIFLVLAAAYTVVRIGMGRNEKGPVQREFVREYGREALFNRRHGALWLINTTMLLVGMAVTVLGADLMVPGAIGLAQLMGVSEAVIGLTIIAIGTSMPELVMALMSAARNDSDVAIGNLVGSSIYNVLVILGLTCLAVPGGVDVGTDVLWVDLPLGVLLALVCYPVFRSGRMVSRREGFAFVAAYVIYMVVLVFVRA